MKKLAMWLGLTLFLSTNVLFAMPNPAAVNCAKKGAKYLMLANTGFCVFPNRTYCEEWAFFRGQCKPGMNKLPGKGKLKKGQHYCVLKSSKGSMIKWCLK